MVWTEAKETADG